MLSRLSRGRDDGTCGVDQRGRRESHPRIRETSQGQRAEREREKETRKVVARLPRTEGRRGGERRARFLPMCLK